MNILLQEARRMLVITPWLQM